MGPIMQIAGFVALLAVAVTPVVLSGQTSAPARCDSIQYRLVDQGAPMTAKRYRSVQDGQSFALRDSIVMDGLGIAEVRVWARGVGTDTTWDVLAQLTPAATSAVAAVTARSLGQTLAVLLGDAIVDHAIIGGTFGSRIPLRIGATHSEADSLAARVRRVSGSSCNVR